MTSFLLTSGQHGEVADLTRAHTKRGQIANLQKNGIRHTIAADGWPVVVRALVEGPGVAPSAGQAQAPIPWKPRVVTRAA